MWPSFTCAETLIAANVKDTSTNTAAKENKARLLQQQYFGTDGYLFAKREELVKPLHDEVLAVIKDVAKEGNFGMIIDVAAYRIDIGLQLLRIIVQFLLGFCIIGDTAENIFHIHESIACSALRLCSTPYARQK